ncbi:Crp/Fnr family transcriptional regulator [Desulfonema magnum]|uniref:Cyclic nucleotide-binding domain-containing protein n=1 Tax=Desulfonema magnum TaxID=45655 RepID=A0A975BNA5_9BACT|nr:cyclic nucleotide-binding domain-containing protein [Desulfonema magnum]QTA88397.1 Cyclic nucleotide-binding domain-containing protein [Desulfonema magnum]
MDKKLLSEFKFFSDVSDDALSVIAPKCDILEFNSDDVVFNWGDKALNLYGVLEGEVELSLMFKEKIMKTDIEYEEAIRVRFDVLKKPIIVERVGVGEVFGWTSLVGDAGSQWTATAQCSQPVRAFSVPAANLKAMFDKDPKLGYLIMGRVSEIVSLRLQNRTDKLIEAWGQAFEAGNI